MVERRMDIMNWDIIERGNILKSGMKGYIMGIFEDVGGNGT